MIGARSDGGDLRGATRAQIAFLTILRVAVGWHFLNEGLVKVLDPNWTSQGYLLRSRWLLSDVFHRIAENETALQLVDILNEWGLALVGAGLMLGLLTRAAAFAGIVLLGLYYVANPPFIDPTGAEGSYLFVDKNLVEMFALLVVLAFPTGRYAGLDRWLYLRRRKASAPTADSAASVEDGDGRPPVPVLTGRRDLLKSLASLPFAAAFAYSFLRKNSLKSLEEKSLVSAAGGPIDALTGATLKSFTFTSLKDLKGQVPRSKIGNLELSRVILGGNLIGGWAHARDLIYVSKLVKAYHSEEKVFQTLYLAERCGINTVLTNPKLAGVINKYREQRNGKIQFISDCALRGDLMGGVEMSIDGGAHACYVQGGMADRFVEGGKIDLIGKAVERIRQAGLCAGIGAHKLATIKACVAAGFKPDFWMKTLHSLEYWSASPKEEHNNIWCRDPEGTVRFMSELEEPWIAFKVLAAGALQPSEAFRYAFESGADFICVGMYDFQIVDDVNIALDVLGSQLNRERKWRA